ncbi:hypothetical protein [Fusibacter sp. A1]|uniref:hypothetical protein n=2 Tax=Fusibacter TaxID=76008 RepID=UPI001495419E|nr:hypothetical protein [Fusibacter sp. A1]
MKKGILIFVTLLAIGLAGSYHYFESPIDKMYVLQNLNEEETVNLQVNGFYYRSLLREDYLLLKFIWNDEIIPAKECLTIPLGIEGPITESTPKSDKIRSQVYEFESIISGKFLGRYETGPFEEERYIDFGIVALTKDYSEIYLFNQRGIFASGDSQSEAKDIVKVFFKDFFKEHTSGDF